jgi:hypothetical protein
VRIEAPLFEVGENVFGDSFGPWGTGVMGLGGHKIHVLAQAAGIGHRLGLFFEI